MWIGGFGGSGLFGSFLWERDGRDTTSGFLGLTAGFGSGFAGLLGRGARIPTRGSPKSSSRIAVNTVSGLDLVFLLPTCFGRRFGRFAPVLRLAGLPRVDAGTRAPRP